MVENSEDVVRSRERQAMAHIRPCEDVRDHEDWYFAHQNAVIQLHHHLHRSMLVDFFS